MNLHALTVDEDDLVTHALNGLGYEYKQITLSELVRTL